MRTRKERRRHERFDLSCPLVVTDADGRELLRARTVNVSDGGALLAPVAGAPAKGAKVRVLLRVPRTTPNTFMYEEFETAAAVVRLDGPADAKGDPAAPAAAVKFARPMSLELAEQNGGTANDE